MPNPKGLSENIKVIRVIGRYLEHCRVVIFNNDGQQKIYLGSANWVARNLRSRVEVVFPVYDELCKKEVTRFIDVQLSNYKKSRIVPNGIYPIEIDEASLKSNDAQEAFYQLISSK